MEEEKGVGRGPPAPPAATFTAAVGFALPTSVVDVAIGVDIMALEPKPAGSEIPLMEPYPALGVARLVADEGAL